MLKLAAIIFAAALCASCSKKTPAYPSAGLVVENGSATCGFYSRQDLGDGLVVTMTTNQMDYTEGGHKLLIEWTSELGRSEDTYEFSIVVDGVRSRKSIKYTGTPITLISTPLKVSIEDVKL